MRLSYDANCDPDAFGESIEVVSTIWEPEVRQNAGWMVFDTSADDQGNTGVLERFDDELNSVGALRYKDSGEVVKDVERAKYLHDFADGSLLVALGIEDDTVAEVWLYESGSGPDDACTVEALLNQRGEPLLISLAAMGIDAGGACCMPQRTT